MAKKTVITTSDDLDGSTKEVSTYHFGWLGRDYEIDLGPKSFKAFDAAMAPYVTAGRIEARQATTRTKPGDREYSIVELREWAAANGINVPSRGRIPQAVVEQFKGR